MQRGFPIDLLSLLRCSSDGGTLRVASGVERFVASGLASCTQCGREHPIEDGILSLLGELHPESAHEMKLRDERNERVLDGTRPEWASAFADATEVRPTLDATAVNPGMVVLELGCGPGRYTLALAAQAAATVAVDFSRAGLLALRRKLQPDAPVALVRADVTQPYAAPRAFDRILSTLHSNLPGREQRMAALRQAATALKADGRAVISMHHHSTRALLLGVPAEGRYTDSGIFRYYMRQGEARREAKPFFGRVRFEHVSMRVPGNTSARIARAAGRIPIVRGMFGNLFLAVSEAPLVEGL